MVPTTAFVLLSILTSTVFAKNDWSVPCWDGVCEYDTELGSMKIWGSPKAISDITTAAGWTILDCDPKAISQDIRLVCHNDNGCPHLTSGGAVNTLVRLPESCGANAFARVAKMWVHEDQSIPEAVAKRLVRRQDAPANDVQGITLDTNFAAVDPSQNGNVSIAIQGSNVPSAVGDATITSGSRRRSRLQGRGLFSFIEDAFKKFDTFDKDITKTLPPLDFDKSLNLFDQKLDCPAQGDVPAFSAELKADVDAKAHAVVSVGLATTGTIVPPLLTSVGVFAGMDASLTGTLTLSGSAQAGADSGKITVFQTGLPGLDFPGILTLGPTFKVDAQATGNLDIGVAAKVSLNYNVNGAKLFFPPSDQHVSSGSFSPADSPLSISVTPSISTKASITAHVIPSVQLGISALGGAASANVFLNLDGSATTTLSLDASTTASASTGNDAGAAGSNVNGCVDVTAGLGVNAGADANFFNLFDPSKQVNIFQKNFNLFKKCLGNGATRRSAFPHAFPAESMLYKRFDLTCPTANFANIAQLIDEPIPAASITAQ